MAGNRTSAETGNPPTGRGVSRIPRIKGAGSSKSGQAGGVASIVGGRLPHPPRSEKVIYRKINVKERKLALNTAIAFTGDATAVGWRGHKTGKLKFPVVVSDDLEALEKTAALEAFLADLGLTEELRRVYGGVKRRSGKARMRGRTTRKKVGTAHRREQRQGRGEGGRVHPWGRGRLRGQPRASCRWRQEGSREGSPSGRARRSRCWARGRQRRE